MNDPQWEPEQLEVGQVCHIERTWCGSVDHAWTAPISKLTAKRAYVSSYWFALDDPKRILRPQYIRYTTRVVRIESKGVR